MTKLFALAALGALAGCPPPATYGYQYRMQQQFGGGEEPEPAPLEARQLLANARTVAFFPPDVCINVDAVGQGNVKARMLRANCGVLLSSLERAAERAGYEVLSWQNLRGNKRPIDYAREANVDVLFEINEIDLASLDDTTIQRTLTFFDHTDKGDAPLVVSTQTAQVCRDYANQADPPRPVARTATIDIKTVSVVDGRARWRYRKTLSRSFGREYPQVMFSARPKMNGLARALIIVGGVTTGVGAGLVLAENVSQTDPLNPSQGNAFDTHGAAAATVVIGMVAAAAGVVIAVNTAGKKPDPADVLCNTRFAVPLATPQPVAPVNAMSAQHTFSEQTGGDPAEKVDEELRQQMIAQFIGELKSVHGDAPPRPAAPAPAPPNP